MPPNRKSCKTRWKVLFQNIKGKKKGKSTQKGVGKGRYSCDVFPEMAVLQPLIFEKLKSLNLLSAEHALSGNGSIGLIHSDGNPKTDQQQDTHCDYDFDHKCFTRRNGDYVYTLPVSIIVALEENTTLTVFEGSSGMRIAGVQKTIHIPMRSALVFRGDLLHGGGNYTSPNTRLHFYYDIPGVITTTFIEGTKELVVYWFKDD